MEKIKKTKNIEIINVNDKIAERAADIRIKYYNKKETPLSFSDSLHIAMAIEKNCSKIITADSDFKDVKEMKTYVY